jgi:vitamin B12/bleomycin/antimicrobial peptide transport system ATP-binding/permease protein
VDTFAPSIDWNHELVDSTVWVAQTFTVTAPCLLVVLVAMARTTEWGRQFWRITGAYFRGRPSLPVWALLAVLLGSTVISVRIAILLSYYTNDLFTALQVAFSASGADADAARASGVAGFWSTLLVFAVLAGCSVVRLLLDMYVTQRFIMRWRIWLSTNLIDDWLGDFAYFRAQFAGRPVDNPDQRIQQDIDIFATGVGGEPNNPTYTSGQTLLFGAVEAVLSVFSFGAILWRLSEPLTVARVTLSHALFWIVIVYVLVATIVAFVIGRPLIRLSYLNELRNAGFRYALIRLREAGAAVGLYRGEQSERRLLTGRLASVMDNYRHWLNRMMVFTAWNLSVSQAINPLPWLVQAQGLFAQRISFGGVWQSATAFTAIHDSLSFFRNAYDQFASYRAAIIRLDGLLDDDVRARTFHGVQELGAPADTAAVDDVDVHTPGGRSLVHGLSFDLARGDALLVSGRSGIGKTVLLQSLAGLWPYASGQVRLPGGRDAAMFVPQLPYLPLGDLRTAAAYPRDPAAVADRDIQHALAAVALSHLVIRLGDVRDWAKALSPGEQQRIAFARILLTRPRTVFLDESTSAMDEGLELMLYELLRAELPEAIVVSVSHRNTVHRFHSHCLELTGDGEWRMGRLSRSP